MASFESGIVPVFYSSELLSAGLAFVIAYLMLRSFRVIRKEYLLGFPIGFSFLALSYVSLGMSYTFPSVEEIASWVSLLLATYGFAFLAATYFLTRKSRMGSSIGQVSQWLLSLLVILTVILVLAVVTRHFLPTYRVADETFRIVNLGLLSYIIVSLNQLLKAEPDHVSTMVLVGFSCLGLGQYSLLLWALDQGFWSFALAHLLRLAGLLALVITAVTRFRRA
jgi:hypothetical protein